MRETDISARDMIRRIADVAEAFAGAAGVGGMETAGSFVAYLDAHPEDIEPFLNGGWKELPDDWLTNHNHTWHAQNGNIVDRDILARSKTVSRLSNLGSQLSQRPPHD